MNKRVTYKISITWNDWRNDEDNETHENFKEKIEKELEHMDGELDDYIVVEHN